MKKPFIFLTGLVLLVSGQSWANTTVESELEKELNISMKTMLTEAFTNHKASFNIELKKDLQVIIDNITDGKKPINMVAKSKETILSDKDDFEPKTE